MPQNYPAAAPVLPGLGYVPNAYGMRPPTPAMGPSAKLQHEPQHFEARPTPASVLLQGGKTRMLVGPLPAKVPLPPLEQPIYSGGLRPQPHNTKSPYQATDSLQSALKNVSEHKRQADIEPLLKEELHKPAQPLRRSDNDPLYGDQAMVRDIQAFASYTRQKRDYPTTDPFVAKFVPCWLNAKEEQGSYNKVNQLVFEDGEVWILKRDLSALSQTWTSSKAAHMHRTTAIMDALHENTSIPVPRVYSANFTCDNCLGCPFTLMECVQGQTLWSLLSDDNLSEDMKKSIMLRVIFDLSKVASQLHLFSSFDRIGAPYFDADGRFVGIGDAYTADEKEFPVFASGQEMLEADLLRWTQRLGPSAEGFMLRNFVQWASEMSHHSQFTLFHPDLHEGNIMVLPNGQVTGVIDWDFVQSGPSYLNLEAYPRFLGDDWMKCRAEEPGYPEALGYQCQHCWRPQGGKNAEQSPLTHASPAKQHLHKNVDLYRSAWRKCMEYTSLNAPHFSTDMVQPSLAHIEDWAKQELTRGTTHDDSLSLLQIWYNTQLSVVCPCNGFVTRVMERMYLRSSELHSTNMNTSGHVRMLTPQVLLEHISCGFVSEAQLWEMKDQFQAILYYPQLTVHDKPAHPQPRLTSISAEVELSTLGQYYNRCGVPGPTPRHPLCHERRPTKKSVEKEEQKINDFCFSAPFDNDAAKWTAAAAKLKMKLGTVQKVIADVKNMIRKMADGKLKKKFRNEHELLLDYVIQVLNWCKEDKELIALLKKLFQEMDEADTSDHLIVDPAPSKTLLQVNTEHHEKGEGLKTVEGPATSRTGSTTSPELSPKNADFGEILPAFSDGSSTASRAGYCQVQIFEGGKLIEEFAAVGRLEHHEASNDINTCSKTDVASRSRQSSMLSEPLHAVRRREDHACELHALKEHLSTMMKTGAAEIRRLADEVIDLKASQEVLVCRVGKLEGRKPDAKKQHTIRSSSGTKQGPTKTPSSKRKRARKSTPPTQKQSPELDSINTESTVPGHSALSADGRLQLRDKSFDDVLRQQCSSLASTSGTIEKNIATPSVAHALLHTSASGSTVLMTPGAAVLGMQPRGLLSLRSAVGPGAAAAAARNLQAKVTNGLAPPIDPFTNVLDLDESIVEAAETPVLPLGFWQRIGRRAAELRHWCATSDEFADHPGGMVDALYAGVLGFSSTPEEAAAQQSL